MPSAIRVRKVESSDEKQLAIGCIVSDSFVAMTSSIVDLKLLEVSYVRTVVEWCFDYYREFGSAPYDSIQGIFQTKKHEVNKNSVRIIDTLLESINEQYVKEEGRFDVDFNIKRISAYMHRRKLETLFTKGQKLLELNKIDKIDELVHTHLKTDLVEYTERPSNTFDIENIRNLDALKEKNELFYLEGAVGELLGPLCRTWFVGFMGPKKRGKSWMVAELAWQGLLSRLKVYVASVEMSEYDYDVRMCQRATALPRNEKDDTTFPRFTCMKFDGCTYKHKEDQEPCEFCRGKRNNRFILGLYTGGKNSRGRKKILTSANIEKLIKGNTYLKNFRRKSYPPYACTMDDIEADLDYLAYTEGFIADIVLTDYADIIGPSRYEKTTDNRDRIDNVWRGHKRLAKNRDCLVVTVTHSNKKSDGKKVLHANDAVEDIRKIAHVDLMATLNQTIDEKRLGVWRMSVCAHRHMYFDEARQVTMLRNLFIGQPILDSEWCNDILKTNEEGED